MKLDPSTPHLTLTFQEGGVAFLSLQCACQQEAMVTMLLVAGGVVQGVRASRGGVPLVVVVVPPIGSGAAFAVHDPDTGRNTLLGIAAQSNYLLPEWGRPLRGALHQVLALHGGLLQ